MPRLLGLLLVVPLLLAAAGCEPRGEPTPTGTPPTATATVSATATTTAPTATVSPGSTAPVTTTPIPNPVVRQGILHVVRINPQRALGFERIVFEFEEALPPASVDYVDSVSQCGSGMPVQVTGGAILRVRFTDAVAHTEQGVPTIDETRVIGPGTTIREAVQTCDFEGVVAWAVGVSGQRNFIVTTLQEPYRLVIDIRD